MELVVFLIFQVYLSSAFFQENVGGNANEFTRTYFVWVEIEVPKLQAAFTVLVNHNFFEYIKVFAFFKRYFNEIHKWL